MLSIAVLLVALLPGTSTPEVTISQSLHQKLSAIHSAELIQVNISMEAFIDPARLEVLTSGRRKWERREIVVRELKRVAARSQRELLAYLSGMELVGEVKEVRSLWLSNVVSCKASKGVIERITGFRGVSMVDLDEKRVVIPPSREPQPINPLGLEWNIEWINAPFAWALGFTGEGVVVGHLDTGVNYNHIDLRDHLWTNSDEIPGNNADDDGNGYIDDYYGYDFFNRDGDPMDDHFAGHGTATSGIIAGDGTGGDTTGVAPDAQLMCLKVVGGDETASESDVWEAIQYAVDNGAAILNLSFGWRHEWIPPPNRPVWRATFENALSAGLIASVAGGNERVGGSPAPDNIRTPGDVPPPWLHPDQALQGGLSAVMTVGATDRYDRIAYFSGYGPVSWEDIGPWNDYPYEPGMGLIDPDISAPGVEIVSLDTLDDGYVAGLWGTSFAAPHVAGAAALLLSMNSQLSPAMVDSLLETTAVDSGPLGKDNDYGAGRLDLLQPMGVVVDLDIDDNSADVSGSVMHLFGVPGTEVFGEYNLVNPRNREENVDPLDGPGNCDIRSIVYSATALTTPEGLHSIPPARVDPNLNRIDQLLSGRIDRNLLKVTIPDDLPYYRAFTGVVKVTALAGAVSSTDSLTLQVSLAPAIVGQNYPNPFRDETEIRYVLSSGLGVVSLKVYNLAGEMLKTLVEESQKGGPHMTRWDRRDYKDVRVSSGVYFCRLAVCPAQSEEFSQTIKMLVLP